MQKDITSTPLFLLENINDNANYHNEHVHDLTVAAIWFLQPVRRLILKSYFLLNSPAAK